MERLRKPLQGVTNIVRFNWPFYVLAAVAVAALLFVAALLPARFSGLFVFGALAVAVTTLTTLGVSLYIYDLSNLYTLNWLPQQLASPNATLLTINAGFDETSVLLRNRYPNAELHIFDFYDPDRHTEASIRRARRAYPAYPNTQLVSTNKLPLPTASVDVIFLFFAAHEIRDNAERVVFFSELHRLIGASGRIVVTEHLRNWPNFLAYNIGFFHFLPRSVWLDTFSQADLAVDSHQLITPFVITYILKKDGLTA